MKAKTTLLTVYCPGCGRRDDFMNSPRVFERLCGCGYFWKWDRGLLGSAIPNLSPLADNTAQPQQSQNGDNTCANGDSEAPDSLDSLKWG